MHPSPTAELNQYLFHLEMKQKKNETKQSKTDKQLHENINRRTSRRYSTVKKARQN